LLSTEAFSPKCTKYRLAAWLRANPLGEITALPQTSWLDLRGPLLRREWRAGDGSEEDRTDREGDEGVGMEGAVWSLALGGWTPLSGVKQVPLVYHTLTELKKRTCGYQDGLAVNTSDSDRFV